MPTTEEWIGSWKTGGFKLLEAGGTPPIDPPVDAKLGGGDDGGMEERLRTVEQSVARIDAILPTLATKAEMAELRSEMHEGFGNMVKWIVGTAFAGVGVFIVVMTFVLNNAVPKTAPASPQQPIIINVPGAVAPTVGQSPIAPQPRKP